MKSASGHTSSTRDLISFLQFEKREKHAWRNVTFSKDTDRGLRPATLLKVTLFHECFSRFLNCTNGTKSGKASQLLPKPSLYFLTSMPILFVPHNWKENFKPKFL